MSRDMRSDRDEEYRGLPWAPDREICRAYMEDERDGLLNERDRLESEMEGVLALASILESCNLDGGRDDVIDWLMERATCLQQYCANLEMDAAEIEDAMPVERPYSYQVL